MTSNRAARRTKPSPRLTMRWDGRDWTWKPTQVPAPLRRLRNRAKNKRARAARRLNRAHR